MAPIDDYLQDPNRALIDAATDPIFRSVITQADLDTAIVTEPDGTQVQRQALSRAAIKRVVDRIILKARDANVDLKALICSPAPDGFDFCNKFLHTPPGLLMRQLNEFLHTKLGEGTLAAAGIAAAFAVGLAAIGPFLAVLAGVVFINRVVVELCECQPA